MSADCLTVHACICMCMHGASSLFTLKSCEWRGANLASSSVPGTSCGSCIFYLVTFEIQFPYSDCVFATRDALAEARAEVAKLRAREGSARRALEQKEKRLGDMGASLAALQERVAKLKAEAATEMLAQLSQPERAELARLAPKLKDLQVRNPFPA